jgi:DNA-binding response OmpR family regulator
MRVARTGYPSLENAVEAANKAADAYVIKPFNVDDLLSKIRENLDKQRDARRVTEQKVTEYIETRAGETDEAE